LRATLQVISTGSTAFIRDMLIDNFAAASFGAVEQDPSGGDELEQGIVVDDIRGQHDQAKPLRLQEQHTVLESA
jgi:hypothetical protein